MLNNVKCSDKLLYMSKKTSNFAKSKRSSIIAQVYVIYSQVKDKGFFWYFSL